MCNSIFPLELSVLRTICQRGQDSRGSKDGPGSKDKMTRTRRMDQAVRKECQKIQQAPDSKDNKASLRKQKAITLSQEYNKTKQERQDRKDKPAEMRLKGKPLYSRNYFLT
jgi:hypothetical protein